MWDLSSLTLDRTHDPGMKAWILRHWTTREVLEACRLLILPVRFSRRGIFFLSH